MTINTFSQELAWRGYGLVKYTKCKIWSDQYEEESYIDLELNPEEN